MLITHCLLDLFLDVRTSISLRSELLRDGGRRSAGGDEAQSSELPCPSVRRAAGTAAGGSVVPGTTGDDELSLGTSTIRTQRTVEVAVSGSLNAGSCRQRWAWLARIWSRPCYMVDSVMRTAGYADIPVRTCLIIVAMVDRVLAAQS